MVYDIEYKDKYNYYLSLLKLNYRQLVGHLIKKHGNVIDNYYMEKSYNRFLNGKIKTISHGKYSKSMEGLFCHHILEDKFQNLSNKEYILKYKYPYEYQNKEYLVYCDLIEHLILHVLITKETEGKYGVNGLCEYLKPIITEWYVLYKEPKKVWEKLCRERAYLPSQYVASLFIEIDKKLVNNEIYSYIENNRNGFNKRMEEICKDRETRRQKRVLFLNITDEEYFDNEEIILNEEKWYENRNLILSGKLEVLDQKVSRKKVLEILYFYYSMNSYKFSSNQDEFNHSKINILKDDLIKEILQITNITIDKLNNATYYQFRLNKIPSSLIKTKKMPAK
nr:MULTISPECIES: hypothetical protein [unclassified Mammaliicoccus]